uniref:ARAD1C09900p n=1 Tax=Blastobotrys adeninivorans TaxID=409370 RepID=A0A060T0P4_BLAAD
MPSVEASSDERPRKRARVIDGTERADMDPSESSTELLSPFMTETGNTTATASPAPSGVQSDYWQAGRIKRLDMVNFMCHEKRRIEFGPRMNLITGKNGSGKSTVLTAISTCLGGRASSSNRGSNVKDLIKHGKSSALIVVTFCNTGNGAYKDAIDGDIYGHEIVVQRKLLSSGSSSYQITGPGMDNDRNRKKTGQKEELDRILDHFQIYIDNPFTILTQDLAREFLTSTTPERKAAFLNQAMFVDKILSANSRTEQSLEQLVNQVKAKKQDIENLKVDYMKRRNEFDQAEEVRNAGLKRAEIQAKQTWLKVHEHERNIEELESRIAEIERKIQSLRNADEAPQRIQQIEGQITDLDKRIGEYAESKNNITRQSEEVKRKDREIRNVISSIGVDYQQISQQVDTEQARLDDLKSQMDKILSEDAEDQKAETNRKLTAIKEKLEAASRKKVQLERELFELRSNSPDDLRSSFLSAKEKFDEASSMVQQLEREISSLKASENQRLSAYGRNFIPFFREFEQNISQFDKRPIGPCAFHTSLTDTAWSSVLESFFGVQKSTFLVFTPGDRERLRRLADKHDVRCQIALRSQSTFDYRDGLPDTNHPTILDVLEFEEEHVKLYFIDALRIENVVLIRDRKEATMFMEKAPKNVATCLALDQRRSGGFRLNKLRNGFSQSLIDYQGAPCIKTNLNALIAQKESSLNAAKADRDRYHRSLEEIKSRQRSNEGKIRELDNHVETQKRIIRSCEKEKNDLEDALEVDNESALNQLRIDMENCESALGRYKQQLSDSRNDLAEQKEKSAGFMTRLQELHAEGQEFQFAMDKLNKKKDSLRQDIQHFERLQSQSRERLQRLQNEANAKREKIQQIKLERDVQEKRAQELSVNPERPTFADGENETTLAQELAHVEAVIRNTDIPLSYEETVNQLAIAQENYRKGRESYEAFKKLFRESKKQYTRRLQALERVQQTNLGSIKRQFQMNLQRRGFTGEIVHSMGKHCSLETVDLKIATAHGQGGRQDTSTLSGGEKSYSQISLLVAIWRNIGAHLLALDEFDVFMDRVNRRNSLQMVYESLRDLESAQSILITPQNLEPGDIDFDSPLINVWRMDDPRSSTNGS